MLVGRQRRGIARWTVRGKLSYFPRTYRPEPERTELTMNAIRRPDPGGPAVESILPLEIFTRQCAHPNFGADRVVRCSNLGVPWTN